MLIRIFIIGRPGSGKSGIAQHIYTILHENAWHVQHLYDYKLLQDRFLQEIKDNIPLQKRKFNPRGPEAMHGFDVIDYAVFDDVLKEIAGEVANINDKASPYEKRLLLIEFARDDYRHALSLFGNALLQNAHIIYIDSPFSDCVKRINDRVDHPSPFGHFVSYETMLKYYFRDDWLEECKQYLIGLAESGVQTHRHHISNEASQDALIEKVDRFLEEYFLRETEPIPVIHDTETILAVPKVILQSEPSK